MRTRRKTFCGKQNNNNKKTLDDILMHLALDDKGLYY